MSDDHVEDLHEIILRKSTCKPCLAGNHQGCTGEAFDVLAGKPTHCWCQACAVTMTGDQR